MTRRAVVRPALPANLPQVLASCTREVRHGTASCEFEPPDLAERRHDKLVREAGRKLDRWLDRVIMHRPLQPRAAWPRCGRGREAA